MRFVCKDYPQLTVCVGDESFITFAAGVFETDDEAVAKVLRGIGGITEEKTEQAEPEQKAPAKKKTAKK